MANDNKILRSINELSLAAWFGGSLMGATGMRRASNVGGGGNGGTVVAEGAGWAAWQPVQTTAIVAQVLSGAGLTVANRGRYVAQRGVATTSMIRTGLTGGAIAATALAAASGRHLSDEVRRGDVDPAEQDRLTRRTRRLQALVPVLTGAIIVLDAVMGEQQRPQNVVEGVLDRLLPWR